MRRYVYLPATIVLLFFVFSFSAENPEDGIYLKSGTVYPEMRAGSGEEDGYLILQFDGPVRQSWKDELSAAGVTFFDYLPRFSFIVKSSPSANELKNFPFVKRVGEYKPEYRISPRLIEKVKRPDFGVAGIAGSNGETLNGAAGIETVPVEFSVLTFTDVHPRFVIAQIMRRLVFMGGGFGPGGGPVFGKPVEVLETALGEPHHKIHLRVNIGEDDDAYRCLKEIASCRGVKYVEEYREHILFNSSGRWITQSGDSGDTSVWDRGLHGENQIVGCGDTGIDYDMCFFKDSSVSVPFDTVNTSHRKIIAYYTYANSNDNNYSGHGTHVAGSIAGESAGSNTSYNGMAYKSKLVFHDIGDGGDRLSGIPYNLNTGYFPDAYNAGARIHSNSWGSPYNEYSSNAQEVDTFMWNNKDFLILYAMGNSGPSSGSIGEPSTAKNCVSVGATGNVSTGRDFMDLADFSSHGPASDGRIKPDLCAPGYSVVSADSDGSTTSNNCSTTSMPGTSMATPIMAGNAALARQYYTEGWYPSGSKTAGDSFTPGAALLKATLVNSGVNMTGSYTATNGGGGVSASFPTSGQGWGIVRLDNALYFAGEGRNLRVEDVSPGVSTGGGDSYNIDVITGGEPFKVTLCWTDYPSTSSASVNLVNDLDLTVSGPSGTFRGNYFSGGVSISGGSYDRKNNLEQVLIASPSAGTYTVTVDGYNVPQGPQPYALVVTGDFSGGSSSGYTISGTVSDSGGQGIDGVRVTVNQSGSPVGSATTGSGGGFAVGGLADGSYEVVPDKTDWTFSPSSQPVTISGADQTGVDFTGSYSPTADILFVDDDNGASFEDYFTRALDGLSGYTYNTWNADQDGSPPLSVLQAYGMVVWNTGADYQTTLSSSDESVLSSYLDGSGNLFLSSQDYLYDRGADGTFDTNYLHLSSYNSDTTNAKMNGVSGDPVSNGMTLNLSYPSGYSDYSDDLTPDGTAEKVFTNETPAAGAVRADTGTYRMVFFAFPFEAVSTQADPNNRQTVMARIIDWLNGSAASTYDISGYVKDSGGTGVEEITMQLSGDSSVTAETSSAGAYSFTGLSPGVYTVRPSSLDYTFQPEDRSVTINSSDVTDQNFTATADSGVTDLTSGSPVSGSVTQGGEEHYMITVVDGIKLEVATTGATGDVDLYVKFGSKCTTSSYDFRPYTGSGNESVTVDGTTSPAITDGDWYIMVRGYAAGSYTLTATVTDQPPAGDTTPPDTAIASGPSGTVNTADVSFTWSGGDDQSDPANLVYAYYLEGRDGGYSSFGSATSKSYTGLSDGDYTFRVKAKDEAGNIDPTPAFRTFTVSTGGSDTVRLESGTGVNDSVSQGGEKHYVIGVPSNGTQLDVATSGASGDVDLYVKFGSEPTTSDYDFRPYESDGNETVTVDSGTSPAIGAGDWYIMVRGYESGSYTVTATVTASGNTDDGYEDNDTSGAAAEISAGDHSLKCFDEDWFKVNLGSGDDMTAAISFVHADGDLDMKLYDSSVTQIDGSASTNNSESVSVTGASAGYYYIQVYGYSGATNSYDMSVQITSGGTPSDYCDDAEGSTNFTQAAVGADKTESWTVSGSQSHSPDSSFYSGADSGGNYVNNYDEALITDARTLGSGASLSFWHMTDIENGYDGGVVEISVGGGAWQVLDSSNSQGNYDAQIDSSYGNNLPDGTWVFTGTNTWRQATFDLSSYAGSSVRIRFRFSSDDSQVQAGWYIDDVCIHNVSN